MYLETTFARKSRWDFPTAGLGRDRRVISEPHEAVTNWDQGAFDNLLHPVTETSSVIGLVTIPTGACMLVPGLIGLV
jgi:hypothetical protein